MLNNEDFLNSLFKINEKVVPILFFLEMHVAINYIYDILQIFS